MIPSRIATAVANRITTLGPLLASRQAQALSARGHYIQTLKSHTQTPKGVAVIPDNLSKRTETREGRQNDKQEGWLDLPDISLATPMEFTFQIDVYESPQGKGFVVRICAMDEDGVTELEKTVNFGPLTRLERDWRPIVRQPSPQ